MKLTRLLPALLTVLVLVAVAPYLFSQSIRLDEAQTLWVVSKPLHNVLYLIAGDVHVPLYFLIMHIWVTIFGNDIVIARIPSFIFYLLSLITLYTLTKASSNKPTAFLTLTFFALSPFVLWYSFEARMYTQFVFFSCLSSYFFLRLIRTLGNDGKLGYILSAVLGVYTHYFFFFLLLCQGLYVMFFISKSGMKMYRKPFAVVICAVICAVVLLSPWAWYVYSLGMAANSDPLLSPPTSFNILQTFAFFLFGFQSPVTQGLIVAMWPMLAVLIFFIFTMRRKIQIQNIGYYELVTFLPILLFFLVSFVRPIFLARYLIFTVPTLFFLLSGVLLSFPKKIARFVVGGMFVVMLGFLMYQNLSPSTPVKENYRGVSAYLNESVQSSDIVAISAPFTIYPIEYTYNGAARLATIPTWDRFDRGPIEPFSQENLEARLAEYGEVYERIFLVLSYDQGYEDTIRTYMETHYHRLDQREFSEGLEVRVYQLRY